MALFLFITIVSFVVHFVWTVPFINFLYKLKFQRANQETKDPFNTPVPLFDKFHKHKQGTPVGGGILIVILSTFLYLFFLGAFVLFDSPLTSNYPSIVGEIKILLFTFISFALLGVYDDLNKIFLVKKEQFFGLRMRHKFIIELVLSVIIAFWLYTDLKISIMHIPFLGVFDLGIFYIAFAAFVIVSFANAVNITDGLDGLAGGILMISVTAFWVVASAIIDVPTSLFIAIWLGGLIAFLYFNIHPARFFMGDTGALSFGATFAVTGLILGKAFSLPIIGGIFVIELVSSALQLWSWKYRKKKLFQAAPFHLFLQVKGWEEPKIVMRFWLIAVMFAIFGLMIAFMK